MFKKVKDEVPDIMINHIANLFILDNQMFLNEKISEFLLEHGIKVGTSNEEMKRAKRILDSMGKELQIKTTELNVNADNPKVATATQIIRFQIKPKLNGGW